MKFSGSNSNFVQIVNIANQHWVCISNKLTENGKVEVYDSLPYYTLSSLTLRKQVAAMIRTPTESITLEHIQVQRQVGRSDCSLFAISFATTLCYVNDPHDVNPFPGAPNYCRVGGYVLSKNHCTCSEQVTIYLSR